jgi:lambda family phage portal protein
MADDGGIYEVPLGTAEVPPIFNAAGLGRRLRTWRPSSAGPNAVAVAGYGLVRNRSRGAARNDPWAGAALDKLTSNEIGTGIQAKTRNGTPDFRAMAKKLWDRWVKVCDADGVFDFYGLQGLVDHEWHEAGEVFIRLRQRLPKDGLPVPLQLQVIEAEQCPAEYYGVASNGNLIRAGIEFNLIGQRIAYWMWSQHPGDFQVDFQGLELRRIPAEQVLHVFEPTRAGQIRGIPRMTSTLVRMFNLDSLDDAVLERQKVANLFAGFYTTDVSADDTGGGMLGDMKTGTDRDGMPLVGLEPGTMQELPPGVTPNFSTPPDAGNNYPAYLRTQLMAIAARNGIPYEVLTGDLTNVSDRALRLILNEFRRIVEQRQWLILIPMFCQRVRDAWWDAAVLAGAIDAPGYAESRDDYNDTLWVPQGYPYSHPVQDVDADTKAVRAGFKSRSSVVLGNGDDPEQMENEIRDDNVRGDTFGFVLDTDPRKTSSRGLTQAKPAGSEIPPPDSVGLAADPPPDSETVPADQQVP